jgi:hypothetical protein
VLYASQKCRAIRLFHTARSVRLGKELMYFSRTLRVPRQLR